MRHGCFKTPHGSMTSSHTCINVTPSYKYTYARYGLIIRKFRVDTLVQSNAATCDFCRPLQFTAIDVFGRIEGEHTVTGASVHDSGAGFINCCVAAVSNAFKYDGVHGLVLFRKHHPLCFDRDMFDESMNTMRAWYAFICVTITCRLHHMAWQVFGSAQVVPALRIPAHLMGRAATWRVRS